jgi:hypothetical protein
LSQWGEVTMLHLGNLFLEFWTDELDDFHAACLIDIEVWKLVLSVFHKNPDFQVGMMPFLTTRQTTTHHNTLNVPAGAQRFGVALRPVSNGQLNQK